MHYNRAVELGMKSLKCLAKADKPLSIKDIAREVTSTEDFMSQIVRKLRIAGFVRAYRGPKGGYSIVADCKGVTAFDVAKALGFFNEEIESKSTILGRLSEAVVNAYKSILVYKTSTDIES